MVYQTAPPGHATPYHLHHVEDEAFYVLDGEFTFVCDGRKTVVGPGGYMFGSGANSKNSTPYGGVKEVSVASFPSFLHIERFEIVELKRAKKLFAPEPRKPILIDPDAGQTALPYEILHIEKALVPVEIGIAHQIVAGTAAAQ